MSKIGFGKYAHLDWQEVPADYLDWLLRSSEKSIHLAQLEIERRKAVEEAEMPLVEKIVQTGYRELAKLMHPDTGGSTADFQRLQASYEQLKMAVRELKQITGGQ